MTTEIPKRPAPMPEGQGFSLNWEGYHRECAAHEHAVALVAVEALHQIVFMRAGKFTLDEIESYALATLAKIEASGWRP